MYFTKQMSPGNSLAREWPIHITHDNLNYTFNIIMFRNCKLQKLRILYDEYLEHDMDVYSSYPPRTINFTVPTPAQKLLGDKLKNFKQG